MRLLPVLLAPFVLAACASPASDYPSLAIRDVERVSGQMEAAPPAYAPPPTPPAVGDRLEALAQQADAAHRTFLAESPAARRQVEAARGAERGSEGWARAQVAIAALESARSRAMIALADLDRIYVDAALEQSELSRIEAIQQEISGQVAQQDETIGALTASAGS